MMRRSRGSISVFELPEDSRSQQKFIDRAEEDLLCAVDLFRNQACGYKPSVTICYLLHQTVEKWLKVLAAVFGIPLERTHSLDGLLGLVEGIEPLFGHVRESIENADGALLTQKFPGNLRYEEEPQRIGLYIKTLFTAAFDARRLAKRKLRTREAS